MDTIRNGINYKWERMGTSTDDELSSSSYLFTKKKHFYSKLHIHFKCDKQWFFTSWLIHTNDEMIEQIIRKPYIYSNLSQVKCRSQIDWIFKVFDTMIKRKVYFEWLTVKKVICYISLLIPFIAFVKITHLSRLDQSYEHTF